MDEEFTQLQDLCLKVTSGGTPLRSNPLFWDGGNISWMKTGEIKNSFVHATGEHITQLGLESSAAKMIPKNSVIVALYGDGNTAGSVAINRIPLTTNQACCNLIIDSNKTHYGFIYYYLKGSYNNLVSLKSGGSQQNLNSATIKSFPIRRFQLTDQHKIAAILTAYDDLIEVNKRRIALLEKMAEELYREWFVRMRFPGHQNTRFVKGVPEGWEIIALDSYCEKVTDGTHDTPKPARDGHLLVTGKNIKNNQIDFTGAYFISEKDHREISKRSGLKEWDILYSNIGTVGQIAFVGANPSYSVKNVIIFRPRSITDSLFLFHVLKNPAIAKHLFAMSSGASQQFIGLGTARGYKILKPSQDQVDLFGKIISAIYEQIMVLTKSNQKLSSSRNLLLPRLISGKLPVEDLDIQFPPGMQDDAEGDAGISHPQRSRGYLGSE